MAPLGALGLPAEGLEAVRGVVVHVTDLAGPVLGVAGVGRVWLDRDAAGQGWFIDGSPGGDEEFSVGAGGAELRALAGSAALGRVDLLTVLAHELGHVAGLDHAVSSDDEGRLMEATLRVGLRRVPAMGSVLGVGLHDGPGGDGSHAPVEFWGWEAGGFWDEGGEGSAEAMAIGGGPTPTLSWDNAGVSRTSAMMLSDGGTAILMSGSGMPGATGYWSASPGREGIAGAMAPLPWEPRLPMALLTDRVMDVGHSDPLAPGAAATAARRSPRPVIRPVLPDLLVAVEAGDPGTEGLILPSMDLHALREA